MVPPTHGVPTFTPWNQFRAHAPHVSCIVGRPSMGAGTVSPQRGKGTCLASPQSQGFPECGTSHMKHLPGCPGSKENGVQRHHGAGLAMGEISQLRLLAWGAGRQLCPPTRSARHTPSGSPCPAVLAYVTALPVRPSVMLCHRWQNSLLSGLSHAPLPMCSHVSVTLRLQGAVQGPAPPTVTSARWCPGVARSRHDALAWRVSPCPL